MDPEQTHSVHYRDDGPVVTGDLGADWQAVYIMAPQGSEIVVAEVRVVPRGELPLGGISARLLRELRPGLAVRLFRRDVQEQLQRFPVTFFASAGYDKLLAADPRMRVYAKEGERASRPWADVQDRMTDVPVGRGDRLLRLAETAAGYVDALNAGDRTPNESVARAQRRSVRKVRDDVYAARGAGLLTRSGRKGKPGGHLTDAATRILKEGMMTHRHGTGGIVRE